jgi:anaerobic ribonucleoside-triphosphate reductase activating protein
MDPQLLRIHRFLPGSRANGPGLRAVLWVQGCSLGCPGCFNPETHPFTGGELVPVDELCRRIVSLESRPPTVDRRPPKEFLSIDGEPQAHNNSYQKGIEGLTISGGEPLQQRAPLLALLQRVRRETNLSILLFTGFTWLELQRMPEAKTLLACIDVLIAGRYVASQRLARHLQGSANKTIHLLTDRYTMADLQATPPAEVMISDTGEILLSGIDPLEW